MRVLLAAARPLSIAALLTAATPALASAQTADSETDPNAGGGPDCVLLGSSNVMIEGAGMLRLGDVAGCPGVRYEVIPGIMINGQPAVRLIPDEECAPIGTESVMVEGAAANRTGDGC